MAYNSSADLYTINPARLEWDPNDTRKVSEGGSLLGEGTFGSVYRGNYNYTTVAIKVIKQQHNDPAKNSVARNAAQEQHAREVRRLLELRFKYVVQCYGISRSPVSSDLLIVTECLEGGSLFQALQEARQQNAQLTDLSFLTIASHVAKGLSYIHDSGFIHGDMKPHNVLLTGRIEVNPVTRTAELPPHVDAKIADFGMSKRLQHRPNANDILISSVGMGNQAFGTYAYMAPEVFSGAGNLNDEQLKRVDVYAFGVVMYEMLTGMSPWQYEGVATPIQLFNMVCHEHQRPAWGPRASFIRPEFKAMVERCWHRDNLTRPLPSDLIKQLELWIKEMKTSSSSQPSLSSDRGSLDGSFVTAPPLPTTNSIDHDTASPVVHEDPRPSQRPPARNSVASVDGPTGLPSRDTTAVQHNRPYWDQGNSQRHSSPHPVDDNIKYIPGESVDPHAMHLPLHPSTTSSSANIVDEQANSLSDYSQMVGGPVTRVTTELIKGPEEQELLLHDSASGKVEQKQQLEDSLFAAVRRQNDLPANLSEQATPAASSVPGYAEPGVGPVAGPSLALPNAASGGLQNMSLEPRPVPVVDVQAVARALQSSDGLNSIQQWWREGHFVAIASAFATEPVRRGAPDRFHVLAELLRQTAELPQSSRKPGVAKDLCIAMGNLSRGASMERLKALRAIPIMLTILHAFSCNVTVYGAAWYALANLLKISNDIADERLRRDITEWLSHAMAFNLHGGQPPPRVPTLGYTTASAVRNYVWMKDANASAFLAPGSGAQRPAITILWESMIQFRADPTVAEACLSAFTALAHFPKHRVSIVRADFVRGAAMVLCPERPARDASPSVLSMGLMGLGMLASSSLSVDDSASICRALREHGGITCIARVLNVAVRNRSMRVIEDSLWALLQMAVFDRSLVEHIVQSGTLSSVSQAISCVVAVPESLTVRCAEMMCSLAAVLSANPAAGATMRQSRLAQPLSILVTKFSHEPRVTAPGNLAINRVR